MSDGHKGRSMLSRSKERERQLDFVFGVFYGKIGSSSRRVVSRGSERSLVRTHFSTPSSLDRIAFVESGFKSS